jgi:PST family polysaccharide transporter
LTHATIAEQELPEVIRATDLDRSLATGIAWSASAKWTGQLISWASFLVVTRLLAPSDFGLVGMALLYCGLLQLVTDAFGTAVTTLRELSAEQLAQLNTISAISGVIACLLSCAAAVPLGHFFKSPHLSVVIVAMSSMFLISGFRTVPYSLLYREMRFQLLSVLEAVQGVVQALTMLALAWLGFRYWTLVLGNIVGIAVLAGFQISRRPSRFAWPRYCAVQDALKFSRHIMVSSLSWYGRTNADFLIAGRVLGQAALGAYTLAWTLATIPLEKVTAIVSNVAYAHFSASQNDNAALRRYLRILTECISIVTFPATIGLALVAGDFVHLLLGAKWQGSILPIQVLGFYASFRCIVTLLPSILNVTGESRFAMRTMQGALVLMPCAFYVGSHWGPVGIAYGWVVAYPFVAGRLYWRVFRRIEMPWREYLQAVRPAVTGCMLMGATVGILKGSLAPGLPASIRLSLEVFAGAAAYTIALSLLHRDRLLLFWNFVKTLRQSNPRAVAVTEASTA